MSSPLRRDLSDREYHSLPALSRSAIVDFIDRFRFAWERWVRKSVGGEETQAMIIGRALHTATLEPSRWHERVHVADPKGALMKLTAAERESLLWAARRGAVGDEFLVLPPGHNGTTRAGKAWNAEHKSDHRPRVKNSAATEAIAAAHKDILKPDDAANIYAMRDALLNHQDPRWQRATSIGEREATWTWKIGDCECKARHDILVGDEVWDIKSTSATSEFELWREIRKYRYAVQAVWYTMPLKLLGMDPKFRLVVVAKSWPHEVYIVEFDDETLRDARAKVLDALRSIGEAARTGDIRSEAEKKTLTYTRRGFER